MEETTKNELKSLGKHALHGAEDTLDVIGHGLAGTADGIADGVNSVPDREGDSKKS